MAHENDDWGDAVEDAAALAREVAPELDAVLLTHFQDAETLDTLRPGETDVATARAVNRAVAAEMLDQGVEVFVQRADRGAFRRWMHGREDTPSNRLAWIDRTRLLRGEAALRVLDLAPIQPEVPAPAFERAPGPGADRLLDAFVRGDGDELDALGRALLEAGREDIVGLALRKAAERHGDANAQELEAALLSVAEGGPIGPSGWAELVALPVALASGPVPNADTLVEGLLASGAVEETADLRFLPGWRSPDAIGDLAPGALRRVLLDMVVGGEPRDLPPGDTDNMARQGFGVLLGVKIDWGIPVWDAIAAAEAPEVGIEGDGPDLADEAAPTPEEALRATRFAEWRSATFEATGGCIVLGLVPPSEVEGEIKGFTEEAGVQAADLDEVADLLARSRR